MLAQATNLGFTRMAQMTNMTFDQLAFASASYLREDTTPRRTRFFETSSP